MDRITKQYLDAFREEQALGTSVTPSVVFEHFVNYSVIGDILDEEFDVTQVHVGGGGDLGLDGVAILVNGTLVGSVDELEQLLEVSGSIDVTFVINQAKASSNFDGAGMVTFLDGVEEFFTDSPTLPTNEAIDAAREVSDKIYENSLKFRRGKPAIRLHYVTTGQWTEERYLRSRVEKRITSLRGLGLFGDVKFTPMGADEIQATYLRSKNRITREFTFSDKVLLPEIAGVKEAYLGVLPATEFATLISDDAGNIRKSLFTDNVRDFQEYNNVNLAIQGTLRDSDRRERFVVLNNGVTIVARELATKRDKITISDYQIVNGCQTSHVIFDEIESLTEDVQIPIKLISTQDEEVITAVIKATNQQTVVTPEDLYALGDFAKKLEAFMSSYGGKKKLFYERRSKQYNSVPGVEKVRIVAKWPLIRSFSAMFLDEPHRAAGYYSELRSLIGDDIFNENHKLEPYYTASFGNYRLEYLFRNGGLPAYYKPARYHLLMSLGYLIGGLKRPQLHANKVQSYCNRICEVLWNNTEAAKIFNKAIDIIEAALDGRALSRDAVKTRVFTREVRALSAQHSNANEFNGN